MSATRTTEAITPVGGRQRDQNGVLEERESEPLRTPRSTETSPPSSEGGGVLQAVPDDFGREADRAPEGSLGESQPVGPAPLEVRGPGGCMSRMAQLNFSGL